MKSPYWTAYYPYAEGGRPDEFTVSSDQTQGNGPSDLLAADETDVTPVSAPVGWIFYHVMSQLTIVVSNSSSAAVTGVSVGGLVPTAEIDYSAPKAAAKSGVAAAEVKACEVKPGATYRAILVPQQAALTVTVTTDDGRSHTKTLSFGTARKRQTVRYVGSRYQRGDPNFAQRRYR